MGNEFINPNWHVVLIHFPLGVFMLGMLLEVGFLVLRYNGSARSAARWMVVLGALAALPAAFAGMYALADVTRKSAPEAAHDAPWHAVAGASSFTAHQWELIESHFWTSGGIAVVAAVLVTLAVACSDRWRGRLYPVFLALLLGCAALMGKGARDGGEMVYGEFITMSGSSATRPAGIYYYVNPMQAHVTLAGLVAAMGLLGIGLSLRATSTSPHWEDPELGRAGVSAMPNPQRGGAEDMLVLRSFAPRVEITGEVERVPAARFWLLTFLLAACTALAGVWVLADHHGYNPKELWKHVTGEGNVRQFAHVIAGAAIVLLPLFMALLARFARRSRAMAGLFALLLIGALAAQVWLGALLLFDQSTVTSKASPWYRFQQPDAATRPTAE